MSLAFAPLFPPTTSTSFCELLAIESCDDVLVFDGEFTPFVTVPAPSPMLSRSSSYGCEGDVSSYRTNSFSGYNYQQLTPTMPTKPNFCKQTSPTGIDSNVPMAMNEYAQLAELWSATSSSSSSAAPIPTSRTSFDSISDTSRAAESNDALLDLFIQTARPSAMASMPKLTRSVSAPVAGAFTRSPNSPGTKPAAKTKSSSKTKKCTYAARRREVSWLRKESATLEAQLKKLQIALQSTLQTCESVDREKLLLKRAREENERLCAVVMVQEQQIRRSDGLFDASAESVVVIGSDH